jgi:predicted transcriptional regulator
MLQKMNLKKSTIRTLLEEINKEDLETDYPDVHTDIETIVTEINGVNVNEHTVENIREKVYLAVSKYLDQNSKPHNVTDVLNNIRKKISTIMSENPTSNQLLQVV